MSDLSYKILRVKFGTVTISIKIVSNLETIEKVLLFWTISLCSRLIFVCFFLVSYTEITNFVQGYIDNEVNFNREDTCSKQCDDFHRVDYHVCRNNTLCILNYLDKNKTRCDGEIRNCQFIESDMRVCPNVSNETSI